MQHEDHSKTAKGPRSKTSSIPLRETVLSPPPLLAIVPRFTGIPSPSLETIYFTKSHLYLADKYHFVSKNPQKAYIRKNHGFLPLMAMLPLLFDFCPIDFESSVTIKSIQNPLFAFVINHPSQYTL
uniref:Uncharacterized protein n=1 Tax=Coccidioides posadasii RMSCC 3488 TaxID=454284 RepID=A0A0J6FIL1_COCPO|nr:hypothetical protein CPAG_04994 [Coccidioides posadasii RMSCC 3488]